MAESDIFFLPVGDCCRRPVVTCAPDDLLAAAAERMRERNISSIVVCRAGEPVGMLTDRDLRNKVVARGVDPRAVPVAAVMNAPLITIGEGELLFEALERMTRHGIHRLVVVDAAGQLAGIVTDSDVLRLQVRSPHQLMRQIGEAQDVAALAELHRRVQGLVVHLVGSGVRTSALVRLIAHLNDRILARLIALLRASRFADLPESFAFVVLGSEGRQEQTLTTDQDNALVYADSFSPVETARLEAFSVALIDDLIAIGVPPCPGGIMARNAAWRHSLADWYGVVRRWLSAPTPENIMNVSMFLDLRAVAGETALVGELKSQVVDSLQGETAFLMRMAANVLRFPPPFGWFGRIKTDRAGALDVKKAGIFALTEGVKVLALQAGALEGGTRERLRRLVTAGLLGQAMAENLEAAFDVLVRLRLRSQVEALQQGATPSNNVTLSHLNRMELGRLRLALDEVARLQILLRQHFSLDLIR